MMIQPTRRQYLGMAAVGAFAPLPLTGCGGSDSPAPAPVSPPPPAPPPAVSSAPSQMLTVGTQSIAVYDSKGTGPAILLVHGNSSSSQAWKQQLDGSLGKKYRIVAIDLPGHGASPAATLANSAATYSIPGYAAIIKGVVAQLGLSKAVIVGWSLGGHAVLEASTALPQAAGFMVFGTPPLPYPPAADFGGAFMKLGLGFQKDWTLAQAKEYVADFFVLNATGIPDFFLQDALKTDGNARSSLAASVGTVGYTDEVTIAKTMTRPLAILQGALEQIVNPAYLQTMAPTIPHLWLDQIHLVGGAGHALQWEQPDKFSALLDAFATSCQFV